MTKGTEKDNWLGAAMLLSCPVFVTIWLVLFLGDPDMLDAIVKRISNCGA